MQSRQVYPVLDKSKQGLRVNLSLNRLRRLCCFYLAEVKRSAVCKIHLDEETKLLADPLQGNQVSQGEVGENMCD